MNEGAAYSEQKWINWLSFLVSPFITLLVSLKNFRSRLFMNLLWAFTIYYGLTFGMAAIGMDGERYHAALVKMHNMRMSFDSFVEMVSGDTHYVDVLQPLITFIVSLFTDKLPVLFAVFGFIYGYFYSRNLGYLISLLRGKIRFSVIVLLIVFAFIAPIWNLNGFRWWTAANMFAFGFMPYLVERKKSRLWAVGLSVLMHFSFMLPVAAALGFSFIGSPRRLLFIFYMISAFLVQVDLEVVKTKLTEIMPVRFEERVDMYTNKDYAEKVSLSKSATNWYVQVYTKGLSFAILCFFIMIFFRAGGFIKEYPPYDRIFCFGLFFCGIANIVSQVPSGGRFVFLANLFALLSIILFTHYSKATVWFRRFVFLVSPLLFLYIIVIMRIGFDSLSVMTIMGNPVMALFTDKNVPLIELIK